MHIFIITPNFIRLYDIIKLYTVNHIKLFLFSSVYVNNCIFCKHATFSSVLIQCSDMSNHKWDDTDCDDTIHNHNPKPIACCSHVHQISESALFSSFCVGNRGLILHSNCSKGAKGDNLNKMLPLHT